MRCLHCGKRLTILRKLSDHEFCSDEHRLAFGREQEALALARLIDAQQHSQQAGRRRREAPRRPISVIPALDAPPPPAPGPVDMLPDVQESGWHGCRKDDLSLLWTSPEIWIPRLQFAWRAGAVPLGGEVWPAIDVASRNAPSPLASLLPDPEPSRIPLVSLVSAVSPMRLPISAEAASGVQPAGGPLTPVPAEVEADLQVPLASILRWPVAFAVRNWTAPLRPVPAKPLAARRGWAPDALPSGGFRLLVSESTQTHIPEVRPRDRELFSIAAPSSLPRPRLLSRPEPEPDWVPEGRFPVHGTIPEAALESARCRSLSLRRLACGSFLRAEIPPDSVPYPAAVAVPRQGRADSRSLLRLARRVPIAIPQADWGRAFAEPGHGPEPSPAFLVPPATGSLPPVRFEVPLFGLRNLRLSPRSDREPAAWKHSNLDGPFVPVPAVACRPAFSAPLLCDWVPVRARMFELEVDIAPRPMAPAPRDGEPDLHPEIPAAFSGPDSALSGVAPGVGVKARATSMRRLAPESVVPCRPKPDPKALLTAEAISAGRLLPKSVLRPLKDRPTLDIERRLTAPAWKKAAFVAADAWNGLSGMTKFGGALMAVLLSVFLASPGTTEPGEPATLHASLATGWETVQRKVLNRAAVALTDDFRSGLADWEGDGDWARSWSYDQAGFVRTGPLAIYTPTRGLTNYRMEFLGQIEKRSLGWVVRAADHNNYQAVKLLIADAGPVPDILIQRYTVLDGKSGPVKQKRLPMAVRLDTLYRIQMELRGDDFSLSVQDHVVDSWTEPALRRGGVGFFSGKGELARLRWVGVWHQYDTLGRLCALLAPQGIADRESGASQ